MNSHSEAPTQLLAGFYREPRRTRMSWFLLVVALAWVGVGFATNSDRLLLLAPIPLLMTTADVLPTGRARAATLLRAIAVLYMVGIPVGYVILQHLV